MFLQDIYVTSVGNISCHYIPVLATTISEIMLTQKITEKQKKNRKKKYKFLKGWQRVGCQHGWHKFVSPKNEQLQEKLF